MTKQPQKPATARTAAPRASTASQASLDRRKAQLQAWDAQLARLEAALKRRLGKR